MDNVLRGALAVGTFPSRGSGECLSEKDKIVIAHDLIGIGAMGHDVR